MMNTAPSKCPICQNDLAITRLHCPSCDTALEGRFTAGTFAHLSTDQMAFVETFVRCEGKITRMEEELGLSYPTIRNRLHEVIRAMGYEPGKEDLLDLEDEKRITVLDDLNAGKISAEDAMRILRGKDG
jgi:hypothetical protein